MNTLFDLLAKGGLVMIPIVGLSIVTLACALDRIAFWVRSLRRQTKIGRSVLAAAQQNFQDAEAIAEQAQALPIGRFLLSPLRLRCSAPETFHLALETAANQESALMRKGDRLLETTISLAPLLGLLGTVSRLISTFFDPTINNGETVDLAKALTGTGEALISTAVGIAVAIVAQVIYRISLSLQAQQLDYFSSVGTELELIYHQIWYKPQPSVSVFDSPPELPLSS